MSALGADLHCAILQAPELNTNSKLFNSPACYSSKPKNYLESNICSILNSIIRDMRKVGFWARWPSLLSSELTWYATTYDNNNSLENKLKKKYILSLILQILSTLRTIPITRTRTQSGTSSRLVPGSRASTYIWQKTTQN